MADTYVVTWTPAHQSTPGETMRSEDMHDLDEVRKFVAAKVRSGVTHRVRVWRELVIDYDVLVWDERPGQEVLR